MVEVLYPYRLSNCTEIVVRQFTSLAGALVVIPDLLNGEKWNNVNGDSTRFETWSVWEYLRDTKRENNAESKTNSDGVAQVDVPGEHLPGDL